MQSRSKRNWALFLKWLSYSILLLLSAMLQSLPSVSVLGLRPLFILPLCMAVALSEGEFAGALFGAVGGLLWDLTSGRTVGVLALQLVLICFFSSVLCQMFLRDTPYTTVFLAILAGWLVLSLDFLFYYAMPGYYSPRRVYLSRVLPLALLCGPVCLLQRQMIKKLQLMLFPDD